MTRPGRSPELSGRACVLLGTGAGAVVVLAGLAIGTLASAAAIALLVVLAWAGLVAAVHRSRRASPRPVRVGGPVPLYGLPDRDGLPPVRATRPMVEVGEFAGSWRAAHDRFDDLRERYAAYECDPLAVLRLPALADVTVPATARFVDAFAQAQALETDRMPRPIHARRFTDAVEAAERAHLAAVDVAQRIRHSTLDPAERRTIERVVKMLTTARLTDNPAERRVAYATARTALTGLERSGGIALPHAAAAALATAAHGERLALPAGRTSGVAADLRPSAAAATPGTGSGSYCSSPGCTPWCG